MLEAFMSKIIPQETVYKLMFGVKLGNVKSKTISIMCQKRVTDLHHLILLPKNIMEWETGLQNCQLNELHSLEKFPLYSTS
jgi:hypothetical protein